MRSEYKVGQLLAINKLVVEVYAVEVGRICLMTNGRVSVRINEQWHDDNIDAYCSVGIPCEGGDGGDNF